MAWMFAFFSNRLGCLGSLIVSVIGTFILLQYFAAAARIGKFVCESKTRTENNKGRADVRQRMPTFSAPSQGAG
jgi:hypothetical protein